MNCPNCGQFLNTSGPVHRCPVCTIREHAGIEKVIGKLGMCQPIMPDPELGQDVAFLAHAITESHKELTRLNLQLDEAMALLRESRRYAGAEWAHKTDVFLAKTGKQNSGGQADIPLGGIPEGGGAGAPMIELLVENSEALGRLGVWLAKNYPAVWESWAEVAKKRTDEPPKITE